MPAGQKFQRKIDEILRELPNVFGIVNDILVMILIGQTMIECCTEYYKMQKRDFMKLNKNKSHFRFTSVLFLVR